MWRPLGPTTSSTSASISSCSTPSPTPTLSASSPSFAAPASAPSASATAGGSPSMHSSPAATDAADTVLMAVGPPVLVDFRFALATVPTGPDEAGGPPPQVPRATGQPPRGARTLLAAPFHGCGVSARTQLSLSAPGENWATCAG